MDLSTLTYHTIPVEDLATFVDNEDGGVYLIGDSGNPAHITGEIYEASLVPGTIGIEIEHGVVHISAEDDIEIGVC